MLRNFLHRILVAVSLVFVFALLLSYLSIYVSPGKIVFPAFFGLAYPYLFLINLFFVFYWIYRKRWSAVIPLFVIVLGWTPFTQYFALGFNSGETITTDVKVMSYNVRYFNIYNWNKDPDAAHAMLEMIKKEDVDIVCFQEFLVRDKDGVTLDVIRGKLSSLPYFYLNEKGNLAIFSKFKITKSTDIDFPISDSATGFYCDLKMEEIMSGSLTVILNPTGSKKRITILLITLRKTQRKKILKELRALPKDWPMHSKKGHCSQRELQS